MSFRDAPGGHEVEGRDEHQGQNSQQGATRRALPVLLRLRTRGALAARGAGAGEVVAILAKIGHLTTGAAPYYSRYWRAERSTRRLMAQRMISRRWLAAVTLQALFAASAALVPTPRGLVAPGRAGRAPLPPLSPLLRAASGGGGSGGGSGKDGGEPTSPFDAAKLLEQAAEQAKGSIEQVVRATGNDQYKFG